MQHSPIVLSESDLRPTERRVIRILRAWQSGADAQVSVWNDLCSTIGQARARASLQAFEQMLRLLGKHGWRKLSILPVGTEGISADEADLARFVLAATEQNREAALSEAGFLVSPAAWLPLVCAASRYGLPLLCQDCRSAVVTAPNRRRLN